ncbi:MAG: hypothetical protein CVV27_01460 [Candidatus Melainabacteria bacterium HGW-Melainabacteria-1]|nr:MAG: hypothetical protein CVV27_01460 [Candidatus Melainabacteria bacterium HGW-Melainabacteria-1]
MKNLNERGEILNQAALEKVDDIYWPLLKRVILEARQTFGDNLHSVYAYGSIAEGRAKPGTSDADFVIALKQPDAQMSSQLEGISKRVMAEFASLVSKIDLPAGTCADILATENLYGWGAYLKILGLPIFGEDLRESLPDFRPSRLMAQAWNGDLRKDIENALALLAAESTEEATHRTIRGISSKAIRSLFMLKVPETLDWTTVFSEQAQQVSEWFPEQAETIQALTSARLTGMPVSEFREVLQRFSQDLLVKFEAELASAVDNKNE